MIRHANRADRNDIIRIWKSCFPDSETYIAGFLDELAKPEDCLLHETDGIPVSMLFLLPCKIKVRGNFEPAFYIYACATLPEHRGNGAMRKLLRFAFEEAVKRQIFALLLIPEGDRLFNYYEKSGFLRFFRRYIFRANRDVIAQAPVSPPDFPVDSRQEMLTDEYSVHWDKKHLRFAMQDFCESGGRILKNEEGYIACSDTNGATEIKEIIPFDQTNHEASDEYYGMIRFCKEIEVTEPHTPYLNWGLD